MDWFNTDDDSEHLTEDGESSSIGLSRSDWLTRGHLPNEMVCQQQTLS
jgi:hypothetical protein